MSASLAAKLSKEICALRSIQQGAAEAEVLRAAKAEQERHDEQDWLDARLTDELVSWERALTGPAGLLAARSWSVQAGRTQAALCGATELTHQAEEKTQEARGHWRMADARTQIAERVQNDAVKTLSRLREEEKLAELADRMARQCLRS